MALTMKAWRAIEGRMTARCHLVGAADQQYVNHIGDFYQGVRKQNGMLEYADISTLPDDALLGEEGERELEAICDWLSQRDVMGDYRNLLK